MQKFFLLVCYMSAISIIFFYFINALSAETTVKKFSVSKQAETEVSFDSGKTWIDCNTINRDQIKKYELIYVK